ncbi:sigma-70 family RNA polymerase sigma factor [Galbitalea soli]|uniref:Sigma-70 family RNA polymerase sigma factor n=1 Tax=Galbitalea soli TaxID=1268042 RepID=A0A7C9PMB1_9MICO|nr:sigma-70 family RNA polymerase sigma factor [Galbitalea soli]NYJ31574.1 RNA polymerase sigma-70 factor (ECF subfamily) [Galbitalea soli]
MAIATASIFTSAYQEHSRSVLGYLRSQGVDDPEAVTQDVFLALYRSLEGSDGGSAGIRSLIFSIAHARAVDHHRRRSTNPRLSEFDPELDDRTAPSPEDIVSTRLSDVRARLLALPPDYRDVLSLRIFGELSIDETARMLGKSHGAIKQLQRRALDALRVSVAASGGGEL